MFNRDGDEISCDNVSNNTGNGNKSTTEFVLIGGKMLEQKVNRYGTFVATSQSRVRQGLGDYLHSRNGFENSRTWKSSISNNIPEIKSVRTKGS